jgi:hypothetical protein
MSGLRPTANIHRGDRHVSFSEADLSLITAIFHCWLEIQNRELSKTRIKRRYHVGRIREVHAIEISRVPKI